VSPRIRSCLRPDSQDKEKASIDEAFFDFTKSVREILLERHPYLAQVPPEGVDTPLPPPPPISWSDLDNVIPTNPSNREVGEDDANAGDHQGADDTSMTWHDVALSIAAELMQKARQEVYTKLGYSTSAVSDMYLLCMSQPRYLCDIF
jgi:DNA polymerase eta